MTFKDYPFDEIAKSMQEQVGLGNDCYQKFSCQHCGQRLTVDVPNVLYEQGTCDQCGGTTDIRKRGCNFLLITRFNQ